MLKKVLICDDEMYILEAVQYVVNRAGFTPLVAHDGEEALNIALSEEPDLIIMDIMMPGRNGFDVCKLLKNNPKTKNIYVIVLTARYESDSSRSIQSGADELITKPFSPRKLQRRLIEVLGAN